MQSKSLALASAFALATSVAAADVAHPRIYFPRVVKREFTNSTITSAGSTTTPDASTTKHQSTTTKRDGGNVLSDLISEILGSDWPPKPSTTSSKSRNPAVTTVVIESTVIVGGSGSSGPSVTIQPTSGSSKSDSKSRTRSTDTDTESGIVIAPTGIVNETSSSEPTTTSKGGILDPIGTLISDILPGPTGTSATSETQNTSTETPTHILPPLSSLLPIGGDTSTSSEVTPNTTSTSSGPIITILPPISSSSSTDIPVVNSTATESSTLTGSPTSLPPVTSAPTSIPTGVPVTNLTSVVPPTDTASATSIPLVNSTVIDLPTSTSSTPVVIIPTTSAVPTTPTSEAAVTSIRPTATVPNTDNWLPTTIVIEPTSMSYSAPTASPTETATGLPTTIPKVIHPNDGDQPPPVGTVPIQIGFQYPLNYVFVAGNPVAAAQIFNYLKPALSDAAGVSTDKIQITQLVPYDTRSNWGYITTIAKVNYPSTLVDTLQMDLWSPNSAIYNNADPIVRNLTALINPAIDIHGNVNDSGAGGSGANDNSGGNNNNNDAFGNNGNGDQSGKQKATTAGIAVAALGLSVMYGAAMFVVARRYKRKRQGHRRSSSVANSQASSEMRYTGAGSPALMGGALLSHDGSTYGGVNSGRDSRGSAGHSARTANISAPVATENSLGWN